MNIVKSLLDFEQVGSDGIKFKPVRLDLQDMYKRTPLHLSVASKHEQIVQLLIQACQKAKRKEILDMKEIRDQTSVFIAARKGYVNILGSLLSNGADPNLQDEKLRSPLCYLCSPKSISDRRLSLELSKSEKDLSIYPSENEILKCIALLIKHGADPNIPTLHKNTPLHICAIHNKYDYLNILMQSSACDFTLKNDSNMTPHQLAQLQGHHDIYNLIKKKYFDQKNNTFKAKGLVNMSKEDVLDWIDMIGLGQYSSCFADNHIDGKTLATLNESSLKEDLQISPLGHRKDILRHINDLRMPPIGLLQISDGNTLKLDEINAMDVVMGDIIGSGYFGEVRRGLWNGTEVAIKRFYRDEDKKKALEREMPIISKLRHPNILSFFGVMVNDKKDIMLITELMAAGSLYANIKNNYQIIRRVRHKIALDIAKGMRHMHACSFLHRDLNTKNILLNDNYIAKISDFGLSRIMDDGDEMTSNVGFLAYMAPEIREGNMYSEKADVYSFGMVLYELFTGREPHHEFEEKKENLFQFSKAVSIEGYRPPFLKYEIDETWKSLIVECWDYDPKKRPSFLSIFERIEGIMLATPTKKMVIDDSSNTYVIES